VFWCAVLHFVLRVHLRAHSGNGKCTPDGKCQCDSGYGRLDCSLEPPDYLPLIIAGAVLGFVIVTALIVRLCSSAFMRNCISRTSYVYSSFSSHQVRQVLISRRMAWIERERKRRCFRVLLPRSVALTNSQNATTRGCGRWHRFEEGQKFLTVANYDLGDEEKGRSECLKH
jgi:hypothetical protein